MRVLACGGRQFNDGRTLNAVLDRLHAMEPISMLIEGGAPGADRMARVWARTRGIPFVTYEANWEAEGKAAGPKRNQRMLDEGRPELVVAFVGGSGTADMVRRARAAGLRVMRPVRERQLSR